MSHVARMGRRIGVSAILASSLVLAVLLAFGASAELTTPQPRDRQVTMAVTTLLRRDHLTKHPLDNDISRKCLYAFLKSLDPWKDYFLQSDVDEFNKQQDDLDDQFKRGDVAFAYTVFQSLLTRVDERIKLVDEILSADIDFTVDEEKITDPDVTKYALSNAELRDKWRQRIKLELLLHKSEGKTDKEAREAVRRRYHTIAKRRKQTSRNEFLEIYLTSLTTSYDPHTTYMSPGTQAQFEIQMRLQWDGIGATMEFTDGDIEIKELVPGGAADKDGRLKTKDRILGVGQGTDGEIVDIAEMNFTEVVALIRGRRDTVVRLKVMPFGTIEPKVYDITRAKIELKDKEARAEIIEESRKPDGTPYKIGVIDLPSFYSDMSAARQGETQFKSTTRDVKKLLAEFRAKNVDAVILDLRRNGGGSLNEAISLTGLFIDEGPVVQVKDSSGRVQRHDDQIKGADWSGPLVVLTSKLSASASEIFAGAIKDYRRGLIVGDRATHGKGLVQSVLDLGELLFQKTADAPAMGMLKITMQQFYLPNGDSTQERGVSPDIELPSVTSHWDVGEEDLDNHLKFDHIPPVTIARLSMVDSTLITELRTLSEKRCQSSADFEKVRQRIARLKKSKERKSVPLNEQKFLAEQSDLNAEKNEEKEADEENDPKRPVVKKNYYFNEALAITLDYLRLNKVASIHALPPNVWRPASARMIVVRSADVDELGRRAAEHGAARIQAAIAQRGAANIIVATGASQFTVLAALVDAPDIGWRKVTGFHLDEYLGLPASHPASFRRYLKERLVDRVPLAAFHYVNGEAADPRTECRRLGAVLAQHPIDVAFIGIGENGHLAFNDPPADFSTDDPYLVVELDAACRRQQLSEGWFGTLEEVPRQAISMSIRQIMKSQAIVCSVPDRRKAEAVRSALEGPVTPNCPASILQKHPDVHVFLDPQSASLLEATPGFKRS